MKFLLDNDVDVSVGHVLRAAGHQVATVAEVGLAGRRSATDDEVTMYADDRGLVVVTHDREFTGRRRRNTVGLHVRLVCEQPDAVDVVGAHLDEMVEALERRQRAVVEVRPGGIRWFPERWE